MPSTRIPLLFALGMLTGLAATSGEIVVGPFSSATPGGSLPSGWRVAKLPGVTATRFTLAESEGITVMQMDASDAGASLFRPMRIDPNRRPLLSWRWRVQNLIQGADLRRKGGDDLPARLYVMFDYPIDRLSLIERAKISLARSVAGDVVPAAALCYVWDGTLPAGTTLWNAYTDRVRMVVVESGAERRDQWVSEQRDVAADFRAAFGEEPPPISGLAIAADTDQTGETVRAWFGDILFAPR